jgi:hypothetical protein
LKPLLPFLSLLLLTGCPDPEKQFPDGTTPPTPTGDAATAGQPGQGAPTPGDAAATAPPPTDGAGAQGSGAAPSVPTLTVEPGTGVKLSGTYNYAGSTKGNLRIDIFRVGADGRPMILHAMSLDKTGEWGIEVPKDLGKVYVMGFVDANGNGPELAEPSALLADVNIETAAVSNLELTLKDGAKNDFAIDSPTLPAASVNPGGTSTPPPPKDAAAPEGAAAGGPGDAPPGGAAPPAGAPPAGAAPADPAAVPPAK